MVLASFGSDLVTGVCMTLVISMFGVLVYRATRSRHQDQDDEDDVPR